MKRLFSLVALSILVLCLHASAANYKLSGEITGGYSYTDKVGTDSGIALTLKLSFDEDNRLFAYAPISLAPDFAVAAGWWARYSTEPLNVIISDNTASGYKWAAIESTFGLMASGTGGNAYAKVWGKINPGLTYAAQADMMDTSTTPLDKYAIAGQLERTFPLGFKLTLDLGGVNDGTKYHLGESLAFSGTTPLIGGTFKIAAGNFADLEPIPAGPVTLPITAFWDADDLLAFAAYAGVKTIKLGPVTLDEISYKMGMDGIDASLLSATSFYAKKLQEAVLNVSGKFAPVSMYLKNAVWFDSFGPLGGYNAVFDAEAALGKLTLGLNLDSKLNWKAATPAILWGGIAELRAKLASTIGTVSGKVKYTYNPQGVMQYTVSTKKHEIEAELLYDSNFGLSLEAWGGYDFMGPDYFAGVYAEYDRTYTTVPLVKNLRALVAGRFSYDTTEAVPMEAIGMLKVESKINDLWSAGLLFISKQYDSDPLGFEPIVSAYGKYQASKAVSATGTITYRYSAADPLLRVYAKLQGDVVLSSTSSATVFWGESGLLKMSDGYEQYYPWGEYYNVVDKMDWDTYGGSFSIKF
ncbi:MAG TPA: hypothetical protein PKJ05_07455 [Bacillota bacterium]|nr:hypothetical protein [Bacillota bacterium]